MTTETDPDSEREVQRSIGINGTEQLGHDIPLCQAFGKIEAVWDSDLVVADAFCAVDGPRPKDVEFSDWMEFVEAVHSYVERSQDQDIDDRSGRVGPIIFANETARRQLVETGSVVTFRERERTTGETWWRESRTGPKQGDVEVLEIGPTDPWDDNSLEAFAEWSGFESVDAWRGAIHSLNGEPTTGYLYHVSSLDGEADSE